MSVHPNKHTRDWVQKIACDESRPIGRRLEILRAWRSQIEREEGRLLMQLGADMAKHLAARGIAPSGQTVREHLEGEVG